MIFLVYIPVLVGFGLFFNLCGLSSFSSFKSVILKELGEVTGGDLGVEFQNNATSGDLRAEFQNNSDGKF